MNDRHRSNSTSSILAFYLLLGAGVAVALCTLILVAPVPWARANEAHQSKVYATGFEPLTFEAGTALLGTDGWFAEIPPFLNPDAAVITTADKKSGRQSVEVHGDDLVSAVETLPYDAIGSYRRPVEYTVSSSKPIVVVESDLLLETNQAPTSDDFLSLTIAARARIDENNTQSIGEMGMSSSGFAVAYDPAAPPGSDAEFTKPIEFNRWYRVSIVLDFSAPTTTVSYYLDDEFLGTIVTTSTADVLARGAMVVYALPDGDGDARANYTARFDNFRISVHGEDED